GSTSARSLPVEGPGPPAPPPGGDAVLAATAPPIGTEASRSLAVTPDDGEREPDATIPPRAGSPHRAAAAAGMASAASPDDPSVAVVAPTAAGGADEEGAASIPTQPPLDNDT